MENVIRAENISKMYKISRGSSYLTLRDSISNIFKRKEKRQSFWALKDVSFDVNKEEIIGIIGQNGAGKTTLLKILARITPPTSGKIRIKGRIASLLEVGTGFHPELSGRENIYLNGSILGMKKKEINSKFNEIVEFSGIEHFLDTPVKRYSSGMYVRLAFSVAAHLEPEILLVDEVLAVGDAQFQKKCLGRMKDITEAGRTVLFVSHNMTAISNLCQKVILLDDGQIKGIDDPDIVIRNYLDSFKEKNNQILANRTDRRFRGDVIFTDIRFIDKETETEIETIITGQDVIIEVSYETRNKRIKSKLKNVVIALAFFTYQGNFIFQVHSQQASRAFDSLPLKGHVYCYIPRFPLMEGEYYMKATLIINNVAMDQIENAKTTEVVSGDFYKTGHHTKITSLGRQGVFVPHMWHT